MKSSLPYRYARALVSLAQADSQLDAVGQELAQLDSIVRQIAGLPSFVSSIAVPRAERRRVLTEVLERLNASALVQRFAKLLLDKERISLLPEIAKAYGELRDDIVGLLRARVISAVALDAEQSRKLEELLKNKTGKDIAVHYEQDPALIGGVIIHLGSRMYDGSVRGELQKAREGMLQ